MKKAISIALAALVTVGFLASCGKDDKGTAYNPYGYDNYYDDYGNGGYGGYYGNLYEFSGTASIVNQKAYENFLRGDFCKKFIWDFCKDTARRGLAVRLQLSALELPQGTAKSIPGTVIFEVPYIGSKPMNMNFRWVLNNTAIEGQANDFFTGKNIPRMVRVLFAPINKSTGHIPATIFYDNQRMAEVYLQRYR